MKVRPGPAKNAESSPDSRGSLLQSIQVQHRGKLPGARRDRVSDNARGFARTMVGVRPDLSHFTCAVMALGDREYADFCAFGHCVDRWRHDRDGTRLFNPVEADGDDTDAQRHWQQQLAGVGGRTDQPDWAPAALADWRLVERRLPNPGSQGGDAWKIALLKPLGHREYSIASIAASGLVELIVRRCMAVDGFDGLGSG